MKDLSFHILDLVENSIKTGANSVAIVVREEPSRDRLTIEISDDGPGMSEAQLRKATDPFFTTRRERPVGLGLALFEQAAAQAGGQCQVESRPGGGTKVTGVFQRSHLDRKPWGDVRSTLLILIVGNPEMDFSYVHEDGSSRAAFSTEAVRRELGAVPINSPQGIAIVRRNLDQLRRQIPALASTGGAHAA